eukprot:m.204776 g.204776  ORF g.204776 m.204776 type:complete len:106 (+) comp39653_c0_seq67:3045-3362(+)
MTDWQFEDTLKSLKWPYTSTSPGVMPDSAEDKKTFSLLLSLLIKIRDCSPDEGDSALQSNFPMNLLLLPLQKRFRFHFYGTQPTNLINKLNLFYPCSALHSRSGT